MGADRPFDGRKLMAAQSRERIIESEASWIAGLVLFFSTVYCLLKFDVLWVFFGITALSLYVLPIVSIRDPFKALPWEMTLLVTAPIIIHISAGSQTLNENFAWWDDFTDLAFAFSISTLGFLLTVEVQMYTTVKMNRAFAVFFVVIFTLAVGGFWQVGEFIGDRVYDTHYQGSNTDVMMMLVWNLIGGIIMGLVYALYMRAMSENRRKTLGFIHLYEVPRWKSD
jgi:hypothetical protein